MRPDDTIRFWEGEENELASGITLYRCGGHFPGGTILHWREGAQGRGVLLTGDILAVMPDGMLSFMFSYPNAIPLPDRALLAIQERVEPLVFDRLYGAFWPRVVQTNGRRVFLRSIARYREAIR
jgi:glyoxylase-like metal-dependent hydrolase (beta-lactamase superfamily II)